MDGADHLGQPVMDVLLPPGGEGPGVLLAHPWWGLNRTIRDYGMALSREGFVVGLADLFGGETATEIDAAEGLIRKHWNGAGPGIEAALGELGRHSAVTSPQLGAIGFSFGGFHLLASLDEDLPLAGLVTYYATHPLRGTHAPVLAHFAADDDFESAADVAAMTAALKAAGPPNATETYPSTKHWFAEADRPEYVEAAAELAFGRTVTFLHNRLG
ncbi:MAG TPA: dienelactone hydrolase family protein [Hyphomicrobiaceae bacterium]|nr:dienelactone hydrolase family protein [Hyphomicrobiaceae bacterium]